MGNGWIVNKLKKNQQKIEMHRNLKGIRRVVKNMVGVNYLFKRNLSALIDVLKKLWSPEMRGWKGVKRGDIHEYAWYLWVGREESNDGKFYCDPTNKAMHLCIAFHAN